MPPFREVKNRIRSVKNISQITRALEAVSASRVRKAQARVLASRAFAEKAWEILLNVQNATKGTVPHPLLTEREEVKRVLVIVITSDRGLAGSYNSNVLRIVERFNQRFGKETQYISVGRKGRDSLVRMGLNLVAEFSDLPAEPTIADISPIVRIASDAFLSGEVDEVMVAYTDFINMLAQRPVILGWLPLTPHSSAETIVSEYVKHVPEVSEGSLDYEYEPNAAAVIDEIVPRFTELQFYQTLLESQASEHAARMAAMRNATDNASQLVDDLTLEYNKARQAAITNEILDIVGGANALQQSLDTAAQRILDDADAAMLQQASATSKTKVTSAAKPTSVAKPDADTKPKASAKTGVKSNAKDDLKKVEGIGPKMEKALNAAGIATFAQLAQASEDALRSAIEAAGMRFSPSLETWAEQASFAAKGDWDGLQDLQDKLVGGRKA